jgi:hypothetical protein
MAWSSSGQLAPDDDRFLAAILARLVPFGKINRAIRVSEGLSMPETLDGFSWLKLSSIRRLIPGNVPDFPKHNYSWGDFAD